MKKLILAVAILIGAHSASAQIKEGNVMVGGNIADFKADFDHQTSLTLNPKAAWFIKDGLAVGAYVNAGFTHINGDATTYSYGLGPMARYYLNTEKEIKMKNLKFFLEANAGFDGKSTNHGGESTNGLGFGVGPGATYFITPNIGVEALVKYNGIVGFGSKGYTDNLAVSIGFQIYLPGKKLQKQIKNL